MSINRWRIGMMGPSKGALIGVPGIKAPNVSAYALTTEYNVVLTTEDGKVLTRELQTV